MAKYHISKNGHSALCRAANKCPLKEEDGAPAEHYSTKAEADKAAEEKTAEKYKTVKFNSLTKINKDKINSPIHNTQNTLPLPPAPPGIQKMTKLREEILNYNAETNADRAVISQSFVELDKGNLDEVKENLKKTKIYESGYKKRALENADSKEKMTKIIKSYDSLNEATSIMANVIVRDLESSVSNDDYNEIRAERLQEEFAAIQRQTRRSPAKPKTKTTTTQKPNNPPDNNERRALDLAESRAISAEAVQEYSKNYKSKTATNASEIKVLSEGDKRVKYKYREKLNGSKTLDKEVSHREWIASTPEERLSLKDQDQIASELYTDGEEKIIETSYTSDGRQKVNFKTWYPETDPEKIKNYFNN